MRLCVDQTSLLLQNVPHHKFTRVRPSNNDVISIYRTGHLFKHGCQYLIPWLVVSFYDIFNNFFPFGMILSRALINILQLSKLVMNFHLDKMILTFFQQISYTFIFYTYFFNETWLTVSSCNNSISFSFFFV